MKLLDATCQCGNTFKFNIQKPSVCPDCERQKQGLQTGKSRQAWKYWNHHRGWRVIDGKKIYFPNRMEANYYRYLFWQEKRGIILDFSYQPAVFDFGHLVLNAAVWITGPTLRLLIVIITCIILRLKVGWIPGARQN